METEYEKPLVLVVDDDPTNLRILVSKLNREYRLGVAKSGTKALEYMGKQIPDLVEHACIGSRIGSGSSSDRGLVNVNHLVQLFNPFDSLMLSGNTPCSV